MDAPRIELLGSKHAVTLPTFAAREEVMLAFHDGRQRGGITLLRVYSAALGLSTRLGTQAKADYAKHRFDVLAYGGEVYGWLREQGATPVDIARAGEQVVELISAALFPSKNEIEDEEGKSEGGVGS